MENNIAELTRGLESYDPNEVANFMKISTDIRVQLFREKDSKYGGSWQQDGVMGAFLNWKRKLDRILNLFRIGELWKFNDKGDVNESVVDTVWDAENYNSMFLFLLFKKTHEKNGDNGKVTVSNVASFFDASLASANNSNKNRTIDLYSDFDIRSEVFYSILNKVCKDSNGSWSEGIILDLFSDLRKEADKRQIESENTQVQKISLYEQGIKDYIEVHLREGWSKSAYELTKALYKQRYLDNE